ncbi:MAG: hypothetical protein H6510_07720 [Acidobacteria bacterium]|nr:hypothetical protein [Acidobacteriota bacterium]MCB9397685.1 hypothetical protein [Acidobacteriota bacterium]
MADLQGNQAQLPQGCYKCNRQGSIKNKRFVWVPPWTFVFLLGGVFLMAIPYLFFKRIVRVQYTVCQKHNTRHKLAIAAAWLSFSAIICCIILELFTLMLPLLVFMVVSIVVASDSLRITKMGEGRIWLAGCGPEFRKLLPAWQASEIPSPKGSGG